MVEQGSRSVIEVTPEEGGQKLLQFLQRRLSLPQPMLHRWVRTGQIRCNGGRCKPFDRVQDGDTIRVPPFAFDMHASTLGRAAVEQKVALPPSDALVASLPSLPPLVYADSHMLVFNKPAGLPVHSGTGHRDSLASRLMLHHSSAPFRPTPAHRLDKDTSGLLLVAISYSALRTLQEAFKDHLLGKEYLTWVHGIWPYTDPVLLRHQLGKRYTGSDEKVHVLPQDQGKEATCVAACLRTETDAHGQRSLMHLRLLTGRTHQIRVQLATEGYPVCGDAKYGACAPLSAPHNKELLLLHALRLTLPPLPGLAQSACSFMALPPWEERYAVKDSDTNLFMTCT